MAGTESIERVYRLLIDQSQANEALAAVGANTRKTAKEMTRLNQGLSIVGRQLRYALAGAVVYTLTARLRDLAAGFVRVEEEAQLLVGSFRAITGDGEGAVDMLERVYAISRETGAPLEEVSSAVKRLAVGMADLDAPNEVIAQMADTFLKLGAISGTSVGKTNQALVQLAQGLASGRLQGDELKSILENMPLVTQALAKEMGVTVGRVKELGSEGKITAEIIIGALLNAAQDADRAFGELPVTIARAMGMLQTEIAATILEVTDGTSALDTLRGSINALRRVVEDANNAGGGGFERFAKGVKKGADVLVLGTTGLAEGGKLVYEFTDAIVQGFRNIAQTGSDQGAFGDFGYEVDAMIARMSLLEAELAGVPVQFLEAGEGANLAAGQFKAYLDGLKARLAEEKAIAEAEQARIEALEEQEKAAKRAADEMERLARAEQQRVDALIASVQTPLETLNASLREIEALSAALPDEIEVRLRQKAWEDYHDTLEALADPSLVAAAERLRDSLLTPADKLRVQIRLIHLLRDGGYLSTGDAMRNVMQKTQAYRDSVDDANESVGDQLSLLQRISEQIDASLVRAFDNVIDAIGRTKIEWSEFVDQMLRDIAKLVARQALIEPLTGALRGVLNPDGDPAPSSVVAGLSAPVSFSGGGGGAAPVLVNIQNNAPVDVAAQPTVAPDGTTTLDVVIRQHVRAAVADGGLDTVMRGAFGLSRRGV